MLKTAHGISHCKYCVIHVIEKTWATPFYAQRLLFVMENSINMENYLTIFLWPVKKGLDFFIFYFFMTFYLFLALKKKSLHSQSLQKIHVGVEKSCGWIFHYMHCELTSPTFKTLLFFLFWMKRTGSPFFKPISFSVIHVRVNIYVYACAHEEMRRQNRKQTFPGLFCALPHCTT